MNIDMFWDIIDQVREELEPEQAIMPLLENLSPEDIVVFQDLLERQIARACRWDLFGAAVIMEGDCTEEDFYDFRAGLVAQGREAFELALENPDSISELATDVISNEDFAYAAQEVYEALTGDEMPDAPDYDPDTPAGEKWELEDEAENQERLPRLWELYGDIDVDRDDDESDDDDNDDDDDIEYLDDDLDDDADDDDEWDDDDRDEIEESEDYDDEADRR